MHSAQKMRKIVAEVAILDKKFAPLIERRPLCTLGSSVSTETHFQSLVSSVISQQLAVKAAQTIHSRLQKLCKNEITPKRVLKLTDLQLREIGVSGAKARTIKGLAQIEVDQTFPINEIDHSYEDQVDSEIVIPFRGIATIIDGQHRLKAFADTGINWD